MGELQKKNIVVKANEVTEIDVTIDPNDITGVEGKVIDELGNPQKGVRIDFYQKKKPLGGDFDCIADSNGYYRMTGMPEGLYEIRIYDGYKYYLDNQNIIIEIKRNILLKKDFIIPHSEY